MDQEFRLLLDLGKYYIDQISNNVITELIGLKDDIYLLSGDDSGLKNVWEEICVQEQKERSVYWDAYENTVENFISIELEKQSKPVNDLLIYLAKIEVEEGFEQFTDSEYVIYSLLARILMKADEYTNINIARYLDREEYDEDQQEEDENQ